MNTITQGPVQAPAPRRPSPRPTTAGDTALRTQHQIQPAAGVDNGVAGARAHARVHIENTLTQGDTTPAVAPPPGPLHAAPGPALRSRLAAYWRPPTVWSDPPASLDEICRYARYGEWTKTDGVWRFLGITWSWMALAVSAPLYYAAWFVQRPGRFFTGLVVYALAAHTPIFAWLPWPGWL
jgi:hypothetical protein